mmetsp:Transcript_12655/g.14984  ORF Transcript_12655/g.14984 Transcript_12655/m.14984 type:complete len:161 (-) Transcript_12655:229-711(-)|eukprot:jgi/Bigna1/90439/estExt_fgenesh1_pg.C_700086
MGVECSKSQVSELENVDEEDLDRHLYKIDAALGEEGDVHVHNDEKMTHIMKKTTHKHASGCCARGGKADLYSTKIVISKKDGSKVKYLEKRFARHEMSGARHQSWTRYKKVISKNGKSERYRKMGDKEWWPGNLLNSVHNQIEQDEIGKTGGRKSSLDEY